MGPIERVIYCLVTGILLTGLGCFVFFWVIPEERGMAVPQEAKDFYQKRCAALGASPGNLIASKYGNDQKIYGSCVIEGSDGPGIFHEEIIDTYDIVIRNTK